MRKYRTCFFIILLAVVYSCKTVSKKQLKNTSSIEVQGHRGDRGNFPENSLEAFISAIDKGVDVIELDIVVSKDKKIVISHEPFMSSQYVSLPDGTSILKEKEKSYNLYQMTYDSIKKFDAGSKGNPGFPKQKRIKTYKPLLSELIDSVENYIVKNKLQRVRYNIEIKSSTNEYDISQPQPERFVEMVMELVKKKGVQDKINIQSFDPAILNALYKKYPAIKTAFLAGNKGLEENLSKLNFLPQIYSPYYKLVNKPLVDSVKALKMRIIPWTVNEEEDIDKMIKLKVDGIITDFPEKVLKKL